MATIPEAPERFDALCRDVTDWITLVESAGRDGVLGILRREIVLARISVPEEARRLLERLGVTSSGRPAPSSRSAMSSKTASPRSTPAAITTICIWPAAARP